MRTIRRPSTLICLVTALALAALPVAADRGDDTDRKSKNGETSGVVGGVEITVEYGRPQVREREIFGGLVPYGKLWRTGADEATTFTVSGDVTVQGEPLAAGTYALFTVPGESEWEIVFNSVAEQWGAFDHDPSKDVLRVKATPETAEHVEAMSFEIEGSKLVLRWAETAVPIEIRAAE